MASNQRASFLFYFDWAENCKEINDKDFGQLVRIIIDYAKTGEADTSELPAESRLAFGFMRGQLDRDRQAYTEKCRKNTENGKKGGRPSSKEPPAADNPQQSPSQDNTASQPPDSYLSPEDRQRAEQIKEVAARQRCSQIVKISDIS